MIHVFKKLVDPLQHQQEEEERKRKREARAAEESGDPPLHRCRVCGLVGTQPVFCPACLAATMVLEKPRSLF